MGFLDILSNKKEKSIPPPVSGEGQVPPPIPDASDNNQNVDVPLAPAGDSSVNVDSPGSMPAPPMPGGAMPDATNQVPHEPENSAPESADIKLDLPTFPSGGSSDMSVPSFDQSQPNMESVPSQVPPAQMEPALQEQNSSPQEVFGSPENMKPVEKPAPAQPTNLSWQPTKYVSEEEQDLNFKRKKVHYPNVEVGTDLSRTGNVESRVKKKIHVPNSPIFTEINNYKRVLNSIDEMKRDLNESQDIIIKLEEFNDKKHLEFEQWKKIFTYIQNKLLFVDKTLFESE